MTAMTRRTEKCYFCSGPIEQLGTGQWVHTAADYDPFEHVHVPRPRDESWAQAHAEAAGIEDGVLGLYDSRPYQTGAEFDAYERGHANGTARRQEGRGR